MVKIAHIAKSLTKANQATAKFKLGHLEPENQPFGVSFSAISTNRRMASGRPGRVVLLAAPVVYFRN
jgi:hypothetical protein